MASIIKRKNKHSVVYYYTNEKGEKVQKWESCPNRAEALRRKAEIESEQNNGTFIPPKDTTLSEFLRDFVKIYGTANWALSTYESNTALIYNYINPMIGDVPIQHITPKFVDEYYQKLQKTKSVIKWNTNPKNEYVTPGVINSIHKLLRCAFEQAVKWELVSKNPFPNATKPKVVHRKRDIWTADMIRKALEECEDVKLYIAINLAFACSLRYGEIAGLTWDKVFISEGHISDDDAHLIVEQELARVSREARAELDDKDISFIFPALIATSHTNLVLKTPKTDSSIRKVWIPKTVAYILREWKETQDQYRKFLGSDYYDFNMVLSLPNGRPVEKRVIEKEFKRLKVKTGLPSVVFHSLRHSSTTYKLKLNHGDLKATQGDTGHAQIDMITDVYAHILDEDRKVNAQKFEAAFYAMPNTLREVKPPENTNPNMDHLVEALNNSPELVNMLLGLMNEKSISTN